MKKGTLHLKFAKALYLLSKKQGKSELVFDQLSALESIFIEKNFLDLLATLHQLDQAKLHKLLKNAFPRTLAPELLNLLTLLVMSRQSTLLPSIKSAYQKTYFQDEGISDIQVCSSREFSHTEKSTLIDNLPTNQKSKVTFTVDASLIGGIQLYRNGVLTDFSVKSRLEHLRRQMLKEPQV